MKRYNVKLEFVYTDEIIVEAESEEEAYEKAHELAEPEYSHWESGSCAEIKVGE